MLREIRARALSYDAAKDVAIVHLSTKADRDRRGVAATLLLDAAGFLVGIDLGGDVAGADRRIVLLGTHEDVDKTKDAPVDVEGNFVRIAKARATIRAAEKNPYV
jgi:hypothetical protein